MSDTPNSTKQHHSAEGREFDPAEPTKTPLQAVKEVQEAQQNNRQVTEKRPETTPEIPGAGKPSDKIHHPQRQLYDGKD